MSPPIHPLSSSQGAVFLLNSCQRYFSCGPSVKEGQALFRSYGCFFAEFLGDLSLVRLGLLDLITCVGLRYGSRIDNLRSFSRGSALWRSRLRVSLLYLDTASKRGSGFTKSRPHSTDANPIMRATYCSPSLHRSIRKSRNINRVPIGCGVRHPLRTD